tara:strand:- start:22 stop:363 length:342 start_codon:yes stop_codon:yes gene_type:complete
VKKYALLLILVSLFSQQAYAEEGRPVTFYPGVGFASCGEYLNATEDLYKKDRTDYYQYKAYLSGFVSGFNAGGETVRATDIDAMEAFATKYCKENPLNKFYEAALKLAVALRL